MTRLMGSSYHAMFTMEEVNLRGPPVVLAVDEDKGWLSYFMRRACGTDVVLAAALRSREVDEAAITRLHATNAHQIIGRSVAAERSSLSAMTDVHPTTLNALNLVRSTILPHVGRVHPSPVIAQWDH